MTVFPDDLARGYKVSHCKICRAPSVFPVCRLCQMPKLLAVEASGLSLARAEGETP